VTRMLTMMFLKVFTSLCVRWRVQLAKTDTLLFQNNQAKADMFSVSLGPGGRWGSQQPVPASIIASVSLA
jgi:hypothetical protein